MQFLKQINDWHSGLFQGCTGAGVLCLFWYKSTISASLTLLKKHTNKRWLMKGFHLLLLSRLNKPQSRRPALSSPASGHSLSSVFGLFTAQNKANHGIFYQHGIISCSRKKKNTMQWTATSNMCQLLDFSWNFCPSRWSSVSKVGGWED